MRDIQTTHGYLHTDDGSISVNCATTLLLICKYISKGISEHQRSNFGIFRQFKQKRFEFKKFFEALISSKFSLIHGLNMLTRKLCEKLLIVSSLC